MKKALSLIVTVFLLWAVIPAKAFAEQTAAGGFSYTGSGDYDLDGFFKEYSTDYINRTASVADKQALAAARLGDEFLKLGFRTRTGGVAAAAGDYYDPFVFTSGSSEIATQNVLALKPAAVPAGQKRSTVIVGAHYDNVYNFGVTNAYSNVSSPTLSHGAYDNASGVAVLFAAAYAVKDEALPFDVLFAAWGAEESGMVGSKHYVTQVMSQELKESTLLAFNLDSVCAGDYLYLFAMDWASGHEDYLTARAAALNVPLKTLPREKQFTNDPFGLGLYSHLGYYSDNYYFMEQGIQTAFFMTMNWESKTKAGVVESDSHPDIMHTYRDTYEVVREYYPDTYLLNMQYAAEIVATSLTDAAFQPAMLASIQNTPRYDVIRNRKYLIVGTIILWGVAVLGAAFIYASLKRKSAAAVKAHLEKVAKDGPATKQPGVIIFRMGANPNHTYPPRSYRPKPGDTEFSVFGQEYEKKAYEDERRREAPEPEEEQKKAKDDNGNGKGGGDMSPKP